MEEELGSECVVESADGCCADGVGGSVLAGCRVVKRENVIGSERGLVHLRDGCGAACGVLLAKKHGVKAAMWNGLVAWRRQ